MPYKTPEERRANYLANRDKQLAQGKEWKNNNREKKRKHYRDWAARNTEYVRARRKAHYYENQEKEKAYAANFRAENPDLVKKRLAQWKKNNTDKVSALFQKRRAQKTKAGGAYTSAQWTALCDKYDNRCLCCGLGKIQLRSLNRTLTPDHIVPISKGGSSDISNIQPLCHGAGGCNNKKNNKIIDYR